MSQADLAHHFYRREPYPFPLLNFPSSLPVQFIHNSYCPQITDRKTNNRSSTLPGSPKVVSKAVTPRFIPSITVIQNTSNALRPLYTVTPNTRLVADSAIFIAQPRKTKSKPKSHSVPSRAPTGKHQLWRVWGYHTACQRACCCIPHCSKQPPTRRGNHHNDHIQWAQKVSRCTVIDISEARQ